MVGLISIEQKTSHEEARLTIQTREIAAATTAIRCLDWDRDRFDIEFGLQNGTTYNSFIIEGEKLALVDTSHGKFRQLYLDLLTGLIDPQQLDYLIVSHTEPDHSGLVRDILALAPQVTVVGAKVAIQFLENMIHKPFASQIVKNGGRFYFDCLHAAQNKQVAIALAKFGEFSSKIYAPAHGSLVKYSLSRFYYDYQQWCSQQTNQALKVALLYASAYGSTATIANAIAQGLTRSGVGVELINCEVASIVEITQAIQACDGFIIGSPTLGGHAPTQIQTALGIVLANAAKTKLAGVFGSYGWSGEAIALLTNKLKDAHYSFGFEPIRVRFSPTTTTLKECIQAGQDFSQKLKKKKKLRTPRQPITATQINRTEQAVGKIVGSLCVATICHNNEHRGILTSWVSQATFNPPGLMISLSKTNTDLIYNPGDQFVLNILSEGRNIRRYFSHQSSNSLDDLTTKNAENGCLIIEEALAYVECTVQSRLQTGDHSLIYAIIDRGDILTNDGITAIQHRQSGGHY